jgi:hypothetical protein
MTCVHLRELENYLLSVGAEVTFRGQAWSRNCREWVYFRCVLDLEKCREQFSLPEFVVEHAHRGTHEGSEQGLQCKQCFDAIMGFHPEELGSRSVPTFP